MRFHLLSLPHTQVTTDFLTCAYTQKVRKFVQMFEDTEHDVVLYAGDQCDVAPTELVPCMTEVRRAEWFGEGFDTVKTEFSWDTNAPYWRLFNKRAAAALEENVVKGDFILLTTSAQIPAAQGMQDRAISVEWAVGYEGVMSDFAIFESYAWMHHVYGLQQRRHGRAFDDVVPNFFDIDDFYVADFKSDQDYLLYIGRKIESKGLMVAAEIAARTKSPIKFVGPGDLPDVVIEKCVDTGLEDYPAVDDADRARLMADARCTLVPTLYVEPFGGVAVESMLSGTPVLASDWGAFTETVTPDVGARFRTLSEAVSGLYRCDILDPTEIRKAAISRFSLDAVRPRFERAFERYSRLWDNGWYA